MLKFGGVSSSLFIEFIDPVSNPAEKARTEKANKKRVTMCPISSLYLCHIFVLESECVTSSPIYS